MNRDKKHLVRFVRSNVDRIYEGTPFAKVSGQHTGSIICSKRDTYYFNLPIAKPDDQFVSEYHGVTEDVKFLDDRSDVKARRSIKLQ